MQQQQPWNSVLAPSISCVPISPKSAQQEQSPKTEDVWRARKKQKRNKPTLSCEECVERKTKVGARVLLMSRAVIVTFIVLADFTCQGSRSIGYYSQEISIMYTVFFGLQSEPSLIPVLHLSHHDATLSSPAWRVEACGQLHPIAHLFPKPNVTTR